MPLKRNIAYEDEGNKAPANKHVRTGDGNGASGKEAEGNGGKEANKAGEVGGHDGSDATRNAQGQQGEHNDMPNDEDAMPVDM